MVYIRNFCYCRIKQVVNQRQNVEIEKQKQGGSFNENEDKKTKQITQIVVSMLLVLTMVFMPMKMILAADAQSSSTPTQFVLVLDCSGSMEESDVNGLSPKAAKMFVDMMPVENAQIAIVAFGANWGEDSYVYPGDTTSNTYTKVILGMTDVGTRKKQKRK